MEWILARLDTWQARLASGLAMIGTLIAVFPPGDDWKADPVAICAFVASALAWLTATLQGAAPVQPHDIKLFGDFKALVDDGQRRFLDTQDFAAQFRREGFQGVRTIYADWDGQRYDFMDKRLQKKWQLFRDQVVVFVELVIRSTMPARNPEFQTVQTARDHADHLSPETRAEAQAMNDAAAELVKRLDAFETDARRILRA